MKRTFTFSYSRKVSTAAYENADVFIAEGFELEKTFEPMDAAWVRDAQADVIKRVRAKVDDIAKEVQA